MSPLDHIKRARLAKMVLERFLEDRDVSRALAIAVHLVER
jgi:hypothetical protein